MSPVIQPETADIPVMPDGRNGVVARSALLRRLRDAERVVQISAPAGSGKTVLLRSWIGAEGLADSVAWVPVECAERDPRRFWVSVGRALRSTTSGSKLVRPPAAVAGPDGEETVRRLLEDLGPLRRPLWLVIDDLHELQSPETQRELELLLARAPQELRLVLARKHEHCLTWLESRYPTLPSRCCLTAPRAGPPGCGSPRCRWPGTRTRSGLSRTSPAVSPRSPSTCRPKCSTGRPTRCGGSCAGLPC